MNIEKFLNSEGSVIAKMFGANKIYARIDPSKSVYNDATAGFIRYGLTLRQDQRFDSIERIQRELSAALSRHRSNIGLPSPVQAIPVGSPSFAIEVPHPMPKALLWSPRSITTAPAHTMLLGRSHDGTPTNEAINLSSPDSCHALIVGITGAGKSVLLQNMMLSLCAGTSPDDLKIILIDLKNEDMLPFRKLPHVLDFAGTKEAALKAIQYVYAEKEKRVAQEGYKPFRLVLWIDEMAQLASMKDCAEMLGDLASIGRGKLINLVGATQYPTEKGGLGGLLKANFPVRLVGMVAPGQSHVATGRPKTHADLLPGKGSFLRCQGPRVTRFQSYFIEEHDVVLMANHIVKTWNKPSKEVVVTGCATGYDAGCERLHTSGSDITATTGCDNQSIFPVKTGRPLTEREAQAARQLAESGVFDYNEKLSLNRLTFHIYGSKDGLRLQYVKDALKEVIA